MLEQDGLILGAWEAQEKGADRKVYALTEAGHREGKKRTQALRDYATLLHTMLRRVEQGTTKQRAGHAHPA